MIKNIFWNAHQQRVRTGWRILCYVVLFVVLLLGAGQLLLLVLPEHAASTLAALVGFVGAAWLVGRHLDKRRFADFGFRLNRRWWLDFAFGLALGVILLTAVFAVEYALGWVTVDGFFRVEGAGAAFAGTMAWLVLQFVCVGIYEEVMARGYLLKNLAEGFNQPWLGANGALLAALALSSAVFGLAHVFNPNTTVISVVNIAIAGVLLGLPYLLTRELALPIGLHITWNFMEGPVFGFPVSGNAPTASFLAIAQHGPDVWTGGAFGPEAGLLGLGAMLAGMAAIYGWVRWQDGVAQLQPALANPPEQPAALLVSEDAASAPVPPIHTPDA